MSLNKHYCRPVQHQYSHKLARAKEELRLVLKPKVQGTFSLKPTILYLDENGKYKSVELETVTIMVKELGIKGWVKGER